VFSRFPAVDALQCTAVWALVSFVTLGVIFASTGSDPQKYGLIKCTGDNTKECDKALGSSYHALCGLKRSSWEWGVQDRTIVSEFSLVCGKAWLAPFAVMMFFIGSGAGCFLWSILADRIARRKLLNIGCMVAGVCNMLCATAPVLWTLLLFRVFLGMGCSFMTVSAFVLASDVLGPKWRSYVAFFLHAGFSGGAAVMAVLSWVVPRWRWLSFICGVLPILFTLSTWSFMVESPSWLLNQGRKGEAASFIAALAFTNKARPPDCALADPTAILSNPHRHFVDILRHARLRRRMFLQALVWIAIVVTYYSVVMLCDRLSRGGNASDVGRSAMELAFTGFTYELLGIGALGLLCDKLGRKHAVVVGLLESGATLFATGFTTGTSQQALVTASRFGIAGAAAAMNTFSWELFPSIVVYPGLAFLNIISRIGTIAAPWIAFASLQLGSSLVPVTLTGSLCIGAALISTTLPETKDFPIPDTVQEMTSIKRTKTWEKFVPVILGRPPATADQEHLLVVSNDN